MPDNKEPKKDEVVSLVKNSVEALIFLDILSASGSFDDLLKVLEKTDSKDLSELKGKIEGFIKGFSEELEQNKRANQSLTEKCNEVARKMGPNAPFAWKNRVEKELNSEKLVSVRSLDLKLLSKTRSFIKNIRWGVRLSASSELKKLIEAGANINQQDSDGNTALHYTMFNNGMFSEVILKYKPDVYIKNSSGEMVADLLASAATREFQLKMTLTKETRKPWLKIEQDVTKQIEVIDGKPRYKRHLQVAP